MRFLDGQGFHKGSRELRGILSTLKATGSDTGTDGLWVAWLHCFRCLYSDTKRSFTAARGAGMTGLYVAFVSSLVILLSWAIGGEWLPSIWGLFISIKFITAMSASLSAIMLLLLPRRDLAPMTMALALGITALNFGILQMGEGSKMPFTLSDIGQLTYVAGMPSIGTCIGFLLVGMYGMTYQLHNGISYRVLTGFGIGLWVVVGVAIIGYLANEPMLYYYVPGRSTGMSPITIALFASFAWPMSRIAHLERHKRGG